MIEDKKYLKIRKFPIICKIMILYDLGLSMPLVNDADIGLIIVWIKCGCLSFDYIMKQYVTLKMINFNRETFGHI